MPIKGRAAGGNLPAQLTGFVGRHGELGQVEQRLAESALVTLIGAGGTGKTRLALRVGEALRRRFEDGVWFIDLTQLSDTGMLCQEVQDPDVLAYLVAATLRQPLRGSTPPLPGLAEELAGRQMLLILDNCEHLVPVCAIVVHALLRGCPGLRVLATSRESLAIPGEVLVPVPPLPAPDPRRRPGLADVERYESVALFVARAQLAVPSFALTEDNCLAVADLCHRVEGLPLAIELAAARLRVLALGQILDRLTNRFALLSRGSRGAPERQQTLRACIDWSFDLCAKPERLLWMRLSVFVGGFEFDAVEGVCPDEHLPEADLLDLVTGLVNKSIVVRDDVRAGPGEPVRYRMLETIREYGLEKLREAGEAAALRRRHRDWHQRLADRAHVAEITDQHGYWLPRLGREQANLRAAMEFCLTQPGEAEAALRLAVTLPRLHWRIGGVLGEARLWLDRALARAPAATALRARALIVNSQLAFWQGDRDAVMRLLTEAEDLARQVDATVILVYAAITRGMAALHANELRAAMEILHQAWSTLSGLPDLDPGLDLHLNLLFTLGTAATLAGDLEQADACAQEALAIVEPRGDVDRSLALWNGALLAWVRGDLRQAGEGVLETLRLKRAFGLDDRYGAALNMELLAWITADQQRHPRAATLLGAADALRSDVGASITSYRHLVAPHVACERKIRDALGDAAFADAFGSGQRLTLDDTLAYALEERPGATPPPHPSVPVRLTRREQQVAELIAQGLSNKEIAAALVVSPRTAEFHVEQIRHKLGFTSRTQVVAWIADRGTPPQQPGPG